MISGGAPLCTLAQGESAQGGGAEKLIFLTLSIVGVSSKQVRMASLEVRLRRSTLRCASRGSSFCQQTLASRAEKVLATAKCRKAKHVVVGPPPRCGRSTALGPSNHLEAAMTLESLILADGFWSRGQRVPR